MTMIKYKKFHNTGNYLVYKSDESENFLLWLESDRCGLAMSFGWIPRDENGDILRDTDGTVYSADCSKTVEEFIADASEFLEANEGMEVEDPGYFSAN